jgi:uncharacterized protein YegP (UPF0339 family)
MESTPREQVECYIDEDADFRWRYRAANGKIIAVSGEGYNNHEDCDAMVEKLFPGVPVEHIVPETA